MSPPPRNDSELDDLREEERAFVEKLGEHFDAAPMSAARRAEFTRELEGRLEGRRSRASWWPWAGATLGAAIAAAVAVLWVQGTPTPAPAPEVQIAEEAPEPSLLEDGWESEILFGSASGAFLEVSEDDGEDAGFDEELPSDYAAIGSFFLDG